MAVASPSEPRSHHIVALETVFCSLPIFTLQSSCGNPIPHRLTSYHRTFPSETASRVRSATIIVTTVARLDASVLSSSLTPDLRMIAIMGAGTDCVDLDACKKRGIKVTRCPAANVATVAEHALGLYLSVRRRIGLLDRQLRFQDACREWRENGPLTDRLNENGGAPRTLREETVGIVGYGTIGMSIYLNSSLPQ